MSLLSSVRGAAGMPRVAPPQKVTRHATLKASASAAGLRQIQANDRPLRDVTADALAALVTGNTPPTVFVRSGGLVRVVADEAGAPTIATLTEAALRGLLARRADFVRVSYGPQGGERTMPVAPPLDVVRDLAALGEWPLPALAGIIEAPTMRPDGSILSRPGYDEATGLYYAPAPGFDAPVVPDHPDAAAVGHAAEMLREVLCDFPYDGEASRANAIAAMMTPVLRPLIDGPAPLFLFDKPQAGSGGSLQAEVVSAIATGRSAAMLTAPRDDEGWRKAITSLLLAGRRVATIDNVDGRLFAPSLAAALTSTVWQDRQLGFSEMVTLPHRVTWMATGNNIAVGGDLPRRCVWIRIDPGQARPWERTGFKHPALLEWVRQHRGAIIGAILTLGRAWVAAGHPLPQDLPHLGSFEVWTCTIGGILAHAGIEGFLSNLAQFYDEADEEGTQWVAFLRAWYELFDGRSVTVADVAGAVQTDAALREALPDALSEAWTTKSFTRKLGRALARRNKMRFPGGLCVAKAGIAHQSVLWRVTLLQSDGGSLGSFGELFSAQTEMTMSHLESAARNSPNSPNSPDDEQSASFAPWLAGSRYAGVSQARIQELMDAGYSRAEATRMATDEAVYRDEADAEGSP